MFTRKQQRIRSQQRHPLEDERLEQRCEQADEWRRTIAIEPCQMNCSMETPFFDTYRAINAIHSNKVIHILQENSSLDNFFQAGAGSLENFGKVGQNLACLVFNTTLNELA